MSKLSEEEIIDNIKFVLRDLTADRYNVNFVNSIKGLLDLYQKEKEKNKELEEELDKYIVKMSDEEYRRLVDIIRDETNKEWKSKVREKIEENKWAVEHYDCDKADYKQSQAVGAWNVLYHLLQEGDK